MGRKRVFLTRKIGFLSADGHPRLLGISTDISELAAREHRMVEMNKVLEHFNAFAVHDLRSPLASIITGIELIERDKSNNFSDRTQKYLAMMKTSLEGMAAQVAAMLTAAKAENDGAIHTAETDINLLIEEIRFNLSEPMCRTGATLSAMRMPSLKVEASLFRQLLQNLVENAIRHRSKEPPAIIVRYQQTETDVTIAVEDNGKGVSVADAGRMFDAFGQSQDGAFQGGVGIGMALCRQIVSLHKGTIRIDPSFQGGCRVVVTLPLALAMPVETRAAA